MAVVESGKALLTGIQGEKVMSNSKLMQQPQASPSMALASHGSPSTCADLQDLGTKTSALSKGLHICAPGKQEFGVILL